MRSDRGSASSIGALDRGRPMKQLRGVFTTMLVMLMSCLTDPVAAASDAQVTWGLHVSLTPTWFDPAETTGTVTSYLVLYAVHDAMIRPGPGNLKAPGLAESWSVSPDVLAHDFVLRRGVLFHTGDLVTAEDVKFSFERYRGAALKTLREHVAGVDVVDPGRVRVRLKRPWPDFLTFYSSATGAGWIVPKKYIEK